MTGIAAVGWLITTAYACSVYPADAFALVQVIHPHSSYGASVRQYQHVSWKASRRRLQSVVMSRILAMVKTQQEDISRTVHNEELQRLSTRGSYIESIKSVNLAGMVSNDGSNEISIHLGDEPNLVAVTGESGVGKSVLIAQVASLVTGGTASPTMLPPISEHEGETRASQAVVEMTIQLDEPQLSEVEMACRRIGLDVSDLSSQDAKLVLKRTLSLQPPSKSSSSKPRLKSTCEINGRTVTLKVMKAIAGPLLTIVDAAVAAAALSKPSSRLAVVDTAVPISIKSEALRTKAAYRRARQHREALESELNNHVLPPSYSHSDNPSDEAIEMLRHWVGELDAFEDRMIKFRNSAVSPVGSGTGSAGTPLRSAQLARTLKRFEAASWLDCSDEAVSEYYTQLLDLREVVKDMGVQLLAAYSARDALSALSQPDSAITAVERARNHLYDATGGQSGSAGEALGSQDTFSAAAEDAHERLNEVEDAMSACIKSLEDTNKGLIVTLERIVSSVGVSLEEIDAIVGDWNTMSRKHAISPFALPSCHRSLRLELDGTIEARKLLPKAKEEEKRTLNEYELACGNLSTARFGLCSRLSRAVSKRLPSLGIRSQFEARLNVAVRKCTDSAAYAEGSGLGIDSVDFILRDESSDKNDESIGGKDKERGGKLESIGSAGEKARILLAIETEFPGSVGALCGRDVSSVFQNDNVSNFGDALSSVAVIYDEIDSHVGGRAAVAMAKLLVDQTRSQMHDDGSAIRGAQVICITHSPSVAAVADRHVVIQKLSKSSSILTQKEENTTNPVFAALVDGDSREEELGRMCGGDLAREESIQFAAALLRDGELQKNESTPS